MFRKALLAISVVFVFSLAVSVAANAADPDLVSWWTFDETSGDTAHDSAGTYDATRHDPAIWIEDGVSNGAVLIQGGYLDAATPFPASDYAVSLWFRTTAAGGIYQPQAGTRELWVNLAGQVGASCDGEAILSANGGYADDQWHNVVHTFGGAEGAQKLYVDGVLVATGTKTSTSAVTSLYIGWCASGGGRFPGAIDEMMIFNRALTFLEVRTLAGKDGPAYAPNPEDGQTGVLPGTTLSWTPGEYADETDGHDVYFGTSFADVNDANTTVGLGVYRDRQDTNEYDPGTLQLGETYYWRVDEVNQTESKIWKGEVWSFITISPLASSPYPEDGEIEVKVDVTLGWTAGLGMTTHDVYLGTNFADVNEADDPDILPGRGRQSEAAYTPDDWLEPNTVYYWRIDEIDGVDVYKGDVWQFTTRLNPDPNLIGWWKCDETTGIYFNDSSGEGNGGTAAGGNVTWIGGKLDGACQFDPGVWATMGAAEAIPVSQTAYGLSVWFKKDTAGGGGIACAHKTGVSSDRHLNLDKFGNIYAWTFAVDGEDETITTSGYNYRDGKWHHVVHTLGGVVGGQQLWVDGQLKAAGVLDHSDFTAASEIVLAYGGLGGGTHLDGALDEVRLYDRALTEKEIQDLYNLRAGTDLALAWGPNPADGAIGSIDAILSWSAGDYADSHDVYFGTDFNDVSQADTGSTGIFKQNQYAQSYDPGQLNFDQTYYWRIDEVNETSATTWKGQVWSFSIANYISIDDFESYTDTDDLRATWSDWRVNDSRAEIYLEQGTALDSQSMKYNYSNLESPCYSEADLEFDSAQNFTTLGLKALTLSFYGSSENDAEQLYVVLEDSESRVSQVDYDGDGSELTEETWHEWNIDLEDFNKGDFDLTSVTRLTIGFGGNDGIGDVYFDNIRLYPPRCVPSLGLAGDLTGDCLVDFNDLQVLVSEWLSQKIILELEIPDNTPQAYWKFDDGFGDIARDCVGNADADWSWGGETSNPQWTSAGEIDGALEFDGEGDRVDADLDCSETDFAVSLWFKTTDGNVGLFCVTDAYGAGGSERELYLDNGDVTAYIWTGGQEWISSSGTDYADGNWHHVVFKYGGTEITQKLYVDGALAATGSNNGSAFNTQTMIGVGFAAYSRGAHMMDGTIDDVRIYDIAGQALSAAEVAEIYDRTEPTHIVYEELPFTAVGDFNQDEVVDFKDFAIQAEDWLQGPVLWP